MSEQKKDRWWIGARSLHDNVRKVGLHYEDIAGKEKYEYFLENQQFTLTPFPRSSAPANTDSLLTPNWKLLESRYTATLSSYLHPAASEKVDFIKGPNEAYKLHLNIPIDHVREASNYLKKENYYHKYLSGGDDPGSIFTLYIGSHHLAFSLAEKLSTELADFLAKPERADEIEFAANVVGRFSTAKDGRYTKYGGGLRGMSCLTEFNWSFWITNASDRKEYLQKAFKATYASLAKDYGSYFHG